MYNHKLFERYFGCYSQLRLCHEVCFYIDTKCMFFFLMKLSLPQELKDCSVVLDRCFPDDKAAARELEEKEDMNRKGGKPMSRIPTFQKRPTTTMSQNTELPVPKKDSPVQVAQPPEKIVSVSMEASKSKLPDVRALPLPSVRIPKIAFEAPSSFISTEHTAGAAPSTIATTPKSWSLSESLQSPLMTVSPRPALRTEQEMELHLPEQDQRKRFDIGDIPDSPISNLPHEGSFTYKPPEEKYDNEVRSRITLTASGDIEKPESAESFHTAEITQEDDIMEEEPPWGTEPMNAHDIKDSRSSSDAECEDDLEDEKSRGHDSGDLKECHEALISQLESSNVEEERANTDEMTSPVAPEKPAKHNSAEVSYVVVLVR